MTSYLTNTFEKRQDLLHGNKMGLLSAIHVLFLILPKKAKILPPNFSVDAELLISVFSVRHFSRNVFGEVGYCYAQDGIAASVVCLKIALI